jgi:hypothetical protein
MRAYEYILSKQTQWAMNHDIPLVGSKGKRGRPVYTAELDQNLYEPFEDSVLKRFDKGDGNEITGTADSPAKMQALHSSSALGVNVFQYWEKIHQAPALASACGFCREGNDVSQKIVFEDKYSIEERFTVSPNIDIVFHNSDLSKYKLFPVECKFSEPYGSRGHGGLKEAYIGLKGLWDDIPSVFELAKSISPNDGKFTYLHAAQLIKHILGLKKALGKDGFRFLYLWYDVPGYEGAGHRDEIEAFSSVVAADDIRFHTMTYQELIIKLSNKYRQEHGAYIKYLTERYL